MEWGHSFDFSPSRKAVARKGRRATNSQSPLKGDLVGSADDILESPASGSATTRSGSKSPTPVAPPRTRRTGGWADETTKSGKRRSAINAMDQERFQTQDDKRDDSEDDIPVIPDLDDLQDDQLDSQVAVAPSVAVNRVATYKELDSDLLKHSAFATLDDINLQLLTKRLNLETDVKEPDEVWTWDLLFTEVSSELRKEWEAKSEISPDKDNNAAKQSESHN